MDGINGRDMSWRSQMLRIPLGDTNTPRLHSSLLTRDLAMGRVFDGVGDNRFFCFKIDPVLRVGNPASPPQQRFDTALLDRVAIAVKRIA